MVCSFDGTVAYLSFSEKELGITFARPKLLAALERLYGASCPTLAQLTCLGLRNALALPSPLRPPPPKPEPNAPASASHQDAVPSSSSHIASGYATATSSTPATAASRVLEGAPTAPTTATSSAAVAAPIPYSSVQQEVRLPSGKRRIIPKFVAPLDDSAGMTPFQSSAAPSSEVLPHALPANSTSSASTSDSVSAFTSSAPTQPVQSASTSNLSVSSASGTAVQPKSPVSSSPTIALATATAQPDTSGSPLVSVSRQAAGKLRRLRVEEDDEPDTSATPMPSTAAPDPLLSSLLPFENQLQLPPPLPPQPDPFSFLPADFTTTAFVTSQPAYLLPGIQRCTVFNSSKYELSDV